MVQSIPIRRTHLKDKALVNSKDKEINKFNIGHTDHTVYNDALAAVCSSRSFDSNEDFR